MLRKSENLRNLLLEIKISSNIKFFLEFEHAKFSSKLMERLLFSRSSFELIHNPPEQLINDMKKHPNESDLGTFVGDPIKIYINSGSSLINMIWVGRSGWFKSHGYLIQYCKPDDKNYEINVDYQLIIFEWMKHNQYGFHPHACSKIFGEFSNELSKESIIEWCKSNKINLKDEYLYPTIAEVYERNIIEIYDYLISQGCPLVSPSYNARSIIWGRRENDDIKEVADWLLSHGCSLDALLRSFISCKLDDMFKERYSSTVESLCSEIVANENLPLLKWLSENFEEPDEECILTALEVRNLEILRWLIDEKKLKCEDMQEVTLLAIMSGKRAVLEYLDERGMLDKSDLNNILDVEQCCTLEVYQWLSENGFEPHDYLVFLHLSYAGDKLDLPEIKWLIEHGCNIKNYEIEEALIHKQNIELLDWLNSRGHRFDASIIGYCFENKLDKALEWFKRI